MVKHIIKREGKRQVYDEKKIYASVYASALNAHYKEEDAERMAKDAGKKISYWIKDKAIVQSSTLRHELYSYLQLQDEEVALMYKHHHDVC